MPALMPEGKQSFTTSAGVPLVGGRLYTYDAGTNTPRPTYSDAAGTTPNANPVILDARGEAMVFWQGAYKVVLRDASDVIIWTVDNVVGGDVVLAADLATASSTKGGALVGFLQSGAGAVGRNVQAKLRETLSVEDFGASSGATATVNTAAIQACINAAPEGSVIYLTGRYQINDELAVNKSLTFMGPNSGPVYVRPSYAGLVQTNATKACFRLVATTGMYAFGQFGVVGLRFIGLSAEGPSNVSRALAFIRCDTTVNSGDFHVRECLFRDLSLRWFTTGIDLTGIAYLNNFVTNSVTYCGTAVKIARGAASDSGGQTRFFGGFYGLSDVGLSLNEDAASGSFSLHGVSVSENTQYGVRVHEEAVLFTDPGCEFESNAIAGIYCEIKEANPNSSGVKFIGGKFLTNGADIFINKTTTAFSGGGFRWPWKIDDAYLGSATGLRIDVPGGHVGLDDPEFAIGRNVAGNSSGRLQTSQISSNFLGTWERRSPFSKRYVLPTTYTSGSLIDSLPVGLCVTSVRIYMTANCTAFSQIQLGDQSNGTRYAAFNGQTQPLNSWVTWTPPVPQLIIDSTNNLLRAVGTAGWLSAAAVVEVTGYLTA